MMIQNLSEEMKIYFKILAEILKERHRVGENFVSVIKHWKCELAYVGTRWFRLCEGRPFCEYYMVQFYIWV
jgi:hypothetical protein